MSDAVLLEIVHRYFEAVRDADSASFQALFAPDAVLEDPIGTPVLLGPEGVARFHRGLRRAWTALDMKVRESFVRDRVAAVRWSAEGTSAGGNHITFDGIDVIEVGGDGRIRKLEGYWDLESVIARM